MQQLIKRHGVNFGVLVLVTAFIVRYGNDFTLDQFGWLIAFLVAGIYIGYDNCKVWRKQVITFMRKYEAQAEEAEQMLADARRAHDEATQLLAMAQAQTAKDA